jgi:pimeloyl-ACP methyl ester carboxylesterase
MAPAVIGQAPSAVAWKEIPSAYVICTGDRATAVSTQRRLAARAQRAFEVGTGHSPFLASPGQLARIITEVAAPATAIV